MGLTAGYRARRWHASLRRPEFRPAPGYLGAVRHPWPTFVFLLPLLGLYELGVARLSPSSGESLRAGVDLWIRQWLSEAASWPPFLLPIALAGLLCFWALLRWRDRPEHLITTVVGMAFEGVVFGLGLWALCLNAPAILDRAGIVTGSIGSPNPQLVTFLGVGIYEEVIFRLIAFAWLFWLLRLAFVPGIAALPLAVLVSSVAFALVHHFVQTDPFVPAVFFTRVLIGAYCALLFWLRGLGVAVGAHVVYDVVVGLPQN
jgi:Type II CAAX prenyl endopeptidase Rce1-like